ncbi:hypothetical protein BJ912DRAFT_926188 [Pholiota molesta]|nr:hypothetical protein BJ912DRAFT_926188 [Pholiota molesta]
MNEKKHFYAIIDIFYTAIPFGMNPNVRADKIAEVERRVVKYVEYKAGITPQLPPELNLGLTYGAYLIGAIVAASLYGILVSQTIYYFNQYPKDPPTFKILVLSLFILDTLTIIFETHGLYHYLIVTFGNFEMLLIQVWSVQNVLTSYQYTIMLTTQGAHLGIFPNPSLWIPVTGRKKLLPGVIPSHLSATTKADLYTLGSALALFKAIVIKVFTFKFWSSSLLPYMKILVAANKSLETCADALITAALCFYLHRGRSEISRTNTMINKLIVFAVNRGVITTFLQLFYLIAFEIKPDSMAWVAFHVSISKVYTNSVLATLNSRNAIRGVGEDEEILSVRLANESMKFSTSILGSNDRTIARSSARGDSETRPTLSGKPYSFSASDPVEISLQKMVESG